MEIKKISSQFLNLPTEQPVQLNKNNCHVSSLSQATDSTSAESCFSKLINCLYDLLKMLLEKCCCTNSEEKDLSYDEKLIKAQIELEQGIDIPQTAIDKIEQLMPKILNKENDPEILWLKHSNNLVFQLPNISNLVFKMAEPDRQAEWLDQTVDTNNLIKFRFENMVKAKQVCMEHHLDLLDIPHAKKIEVVVNGRSYPLIAEEFLHINQDASIQEHLYYMYPERLTETIKQLTLFIAKTHFNDVKWNNIPIMDPDSPGPLHIALPDLEEMRDPYQGIFGGKFQGLIGCLGSEKLIDIVIEEACRHYVSFTAEQARDAKENRMKSLEQDHALYRFHAMKGLRGSEQIQVDFDTLGLDLNEAGEVKLTNFRDGDIHIEQTRQTLRDAAQFIVKTINKGIKKNSPHASLKGSRYVELKKTNYPLFSYSELGVPRGRFTATEILKQSWLGRVLQSLVDKGHIHNFGIDKKGIYFIQA